MLKDRKSIESPLVNLTLLKNKYFVYGTVFAALLYFTMCGINVMLPLFVQNVANLSPTTSGLILLPVAVVMVVFNFISTILAATVLNILGFASMMTYNIDSSFEYMLVTQIIRGIGYGLGLTPAITWTMSVVV